MQDQTPADACRCIHCQTRVDNSPNYLRTGDPDSFLNSHRVIPRLIKGHSVTFARYQCPGCCFEFKAKGNYMKHTPAICNKRQEGQLNEYPPNSMPSKDEEFEGTMRRFSTYPDGVVLTAWAKTVFRENLLPKEILSNDALCTKWTEIWKWAQKQNIDALREDLVAEYEHFKNRTKGPIPCLQCLRLYCVGRRKAECQEMRSRFFWEKLSGRVEDLYEQEKRKQQQ